MRWDNGQALDGLDLEEWTKRFKIQFVSSEVLEGRFAAIHALTTLGKILGLGSYDVLIDKSLMALREPLILHEAIENYLRRQGWTYPDSDEYAEMAVKHLLKTTASGRRVLARLSTI